MKPCRENQKLIAWLALDALESSPAGRLRTHLQTCPNCRGYFEELRRVMDVLDSAQPRSEVTASAAFHQRLTRAVENEPRTGSLLRFWREAFAGWRVGLPWAGAALALLVGWALLRHAPLNFKHEGVTQIASLAADSEPTMASYEKVASQSFDAFDQLLTRRGDKSALSVPSIPMYRLKQLELAEQ